MAMAFALGAGEVVAVGVAEQEALKVQDYIFPGFVPF
jgi:hypothetical protein